jgi:hypothetical protein
MPIHEKHSTKDVKPSSLRSRLVFASQTASVAAPRERDNSRTLSISHSQFELIIWLRQGVNPLTYLPIDLLAHLPICPFSHFKSLTFSIYSLKIEVLRNPFSIFHFPFSIFHFPFTVYRLPFTVYRLPFTVYRLPFTVYRLPFTVYNIMKPSTITLSILALVALFFIAQSCAPAADTQKTTFESTNDESHLGSNAPGLAIQMKYIQHWTHKLGLSVEAQNAELVEFYHHELEEGAEDLIATIEEYDGFPIAELTRTMLLPQILAFETAEESGDWQQIRQAYQAIIASCNSCHQATAHGYIKIVDGFGNNPFNQDFSAD